MGVSLLEKCDNQRALSHLLKAVKFNRRDPLIHHTLAVVYFALEKYSLAETSLKKALSLNGQLTESRVTLAKVYLRMGKPSAAMKELKRAEKDLTYPGYFKLAGLKGEAWFHLKQWAKAKKLLSEATRQTGGKSHCFVFTLLGRTEFQLKNYKASVKFLNKASSFCQRQTPVCEKKKFPEQYFLARSYNKLKKTFRAKYHLKIFLKRTDKSDPLFSKAQALLKSL